MKTLKVEFPDNVVRIENTTEFKIVAHVLEVPVGTRGRPPKAALAKAIADAGMTIDDTDYFKAADADGGSGDRSEYGAQLKLARDERDAAIAEANKAFEETRNALRAEYGITNGATVAAKPATTRTAYEVTAKVPIKDKDTGELALTKAGKARYAPSASKVTLTTEQVRALSNAGERGRLSESSVVTAAAVFESDTHKRWIPVSVMNNVSELLKDVTVTKVDA